MAQATVPDLGMTDYAVREHRSLWLDAWRRLISSKTSRLGMFTVAVFVLSAVFAHFFWEYDPARDLNYSLKLKSPTLAATEEVESIHPFGTDKLGRDIFRRTVHGGWNSLRVGLVAVMISMVIGVVLGLLAGFYESMPITRMEMYVMQGLVGLGLGFFITWISYQPVQMFLFMLLGIVSVHFHRWQAGKPLRYVVFGSVGALLGVAAGFLIGMAAIIVCSGLGALIGLALAKPLNGRFFSNVVMRVMDILLSFPSYLLAIAIVAFLGPGLEKGMIAIGVVGIPAYARLARSAVLSVAQKEYVLAAQAVGESHSRTIFRHIFPNILSPIIIQATMGLAGAILSAAALGFLGLGAIPPEPEWGAMLGDSYKYLSSGAWWAVLFPGMAIMLSVLGFNLLGDGLRDALDPKLRI
jgi:ABC-type dipeptide/oligopeptide/nickel transport system permease subunit